MERKVRQETIIDYLRVKPSTHGEVETGLLAIPNKEKVKNEILQQERELIEETFKEQGTNLIPIIVRRIEPDEEEHEYEVVYGQKWCIIAEELGIDRLWTWVFDLEDDQVPLIQEKMGALAGNKPSDGLVKAFEVNLEPSLLAELNEGKVQIHIEIKPTVEVQKKSITKEYNQMNATELKALAKKRGLTGYSRLRKQELVKLHQDWDKNKSN
ncbi:UNVERIFIED_CONTAM: hypothetical protein BEN50_22975 [Euhalothece sp. KZN 001]